MLSSRRDLSKLFQSVDELLEPEEAYIEGDVPSWVAGKFLRVGPAKFELNDGFPMNHWLDGYAMLSKFEINPTQKSVKFMKKFVQSDALRRALISNRPVIAEFGTKACPDKSKNILSRFVNSIVPELTDNNCSNIVTIGSDVLVVTDSCYMRQIDPTSLKTGEKFDSNKLFGLQAVSAHPLKDQKTGWMYNIGLSMVTGVKFSVIKIPIESRTNLRAKDAMKRAKIIASIPSSYSHGCASYVHSFGMSENFLVFIEQPYVASIGAIATAIMKGSCVKEWFEWKPQEINRFHVIEKDTGKLLKTEMVAEKPFFFLHVANCFENDDEEIIVDICAYENADLLDEMFLHKLRSGNVDQSPQPALKRFKIPLENKLLLSDPCKKAMKLVAEPFTASGCEMPVLNSNYRGYENSYVYVNGTLAVNEFCNKLCKVNMKDKHVVSWKECETLFPGEPIFIPKPGESEEDDGILISAVLNSDHSGQDILVFLCAKTLKEVGRAKFTTQVPGSLHGIFLPDEEIISH